MNKLSNPVTNDRLAELANKGMICICQDEEYQSMAAELLARREAAEKPVAIVEHSDYITAAQMAGDEPRRKAVKELYEGALVVGNNLYAAPPLPVVPDEGPYALKPKSELSQRAERLAAETYPNYSK